MVRYLADWLYCYSLWFWVYTSGSPEHGKVPRLWL